MDGGMHALDLASEAVWALVWERLGADQAAKRALAETSRALHDLALATWSDVKFRPKEAYTHGPYGAAFSVATLRAADSHAAAAAAFLNRLRLQHLQPLSQLPALEMLYMANAACRTSGLAALARVRPWTRLQFLELDDDGDGGIGAHGGGEDWAFPALQALYLRSPTISLQRVEQLAMHCPVLVEVTRQEGVPCSVRLCIPAAASAAQAAAQLRRLQHLHGRHLLKSLHVSGKDGLPPVAVLSEAAAQTWCLSLPGVEELQVVHWDDAESSTEQHLAWLLGLLPNVRLLEFGDCGQLSGGGALAALQQHVQLRQQQPGGKDRTMVVRLSGDLPGFSWEGLCAWAAALPAGHHAPLEFLLVDAYLEDMPEGAPAQPLAGTTLTRMLRVAGRGHVTVRIAEAK